MLMVFVPDGTFQMGSDESDPAAEAGEFPAHTVTLDGFWIDQTEVTNAHYSLCVEAGACQDSRVADDPPTTVTTFRWWVWPGRMLQITAFGRVEGCRLKQNGKYAAKGEGNIYPWGDMFDSSRLNYCDVNCSESWADSVVDDGYSENAPVGSYPGGASWAGALDMAGNVWEWVWDWYSDYTSDPQTNPRGPESGFYKIMHAAAAGRAGQRVCVQPTALKAAGISAR